jgi:hypothetical protein
MKYFAGRRAANEYMEEQAKVQATREPLHPFNMKFWPLTMKPHSVDTSVDQYDSTLNSFDIVQNSRTALACEVCRTRLRIIHCKTCLKGFCFFCAFRTHTASSKRNHQMQIMEPRVVKYKAVSTSLTYHVDMAGSVAHDLSYLVKYMRSAGEVRIHTYTHTIIDTSIHHIHHIHTYTHTTPINMTHIHIHLSGEAHPEGEAASEGVRAAGRRPN